MGRSRCGCAAVASCLVAGGSQRGPLRAWAAASAGGRRCACFTTLSPPRAHAPSRTASDSFRFPEATRGSSPPPAAARSQGVAQHLRPAQQRARTLRRRSARGPRQARARAVGRVPLSALAARCGSGWADGAGRRRVGAAARRGRGDAAWERLGGRGVPPPRGSGCAERAADAAWERPRRPRRPAPFGSGRRPRVGRPHPLDIVVIPRLGSRSHRMTTLSWRGEPGLEETTTTWPGRRCETSRARRA
jgi:hypothetical protein